MAHSQRIISMAQLPGDKKPAEQFAPLASTFRRRLTFGLASASLVALGANFGGVTSLLLGFSPERGRDLKLDVLYPIAGFSRCLASQGFEFIYPASWVGDQTLLYRAAERNELGRSLDPPPLSSDSVGRSRMNVNEPVVAFGPPGSTGELNVSVIVSTVSPDFSIESFGEAKEIGEAVVKTIAESRRQGVQGSLVNSNVRKGSRDISYYELEFRVTSSEFERHNIAVCCSNKGKLYTLNAQAPESSWSNVKDHFQKIAQSFALTS